MIVSGLGSWSPIRTLKGTGFDPLSLKPLPNLFLGSLQLILCLPSSPSLLSPILPNVSPLLPNLPSSASPSLPLSTSLLSPSSTRLPPPGCFRPLSRSPPTPSVPLPPPECMAAIGWSLRFECSLLASGWRWCGSTAPHAPSPCRLKPGRSKVGGASETTRNQRKPPTYLDSIILKLYVA